MSKTWYEFKNKADKTVELSIYDEIGMWGVSAKDFIDELAQHKGKAVELHINSPGGSIVEGNAIYNALKRHDGGVTSQIDGLAASMATVVALAGNPVKMAENALFMIHNPAGGAIGGSSDLRKAADVMDKMRISLVSTYSAKTGMDEEAIGEMMDNETWMTAEEAKDKGFIDEVTDRVDAAAIADFDLAGFKNSAAALARVDIKGKFNMADNTAELSNAIAERDLARAQAQKNFTDYQAVVAERDLANTVAKNALADLATAKSEVVTVKAELATITGERDAQKAKLETFDADVAAKANAGIQAAMAKHGVPPVKLDGVEAPGTKAKADVSKLTGLEKAIAAHKAELSQATK